MFQFTKDDIMYFIELGVMLILGIIVVFMVVRPLLKRVLAADPAAAPEVAALPALPDTPVAPVNPQPQLPNSATAQMIDVAQVQGQVHAQSVHRVGELAERNPNETASIIRQWLAEPA